MHCNHKEVRYFITLIVSFILIINCIGILAYAKSDHEKSKKIKVTIDIFSGRENPVIFVKEKSHKEKVKSLVQKSKVHKINSKVQGAITGDSIRPSKLGYRGLIIDNQENIAGLPGSCDVYKGKIKMKGDNNIYIDESAEIERYLIDHALSQEVINNDVYDAIKSELASD